MAPQLSEPAAPEARAPSALPPRLRHAWTDADLALAVYLHELVAGRRVAWIVSPGEDAPHYLEEVVRELRVLAPSSLGELEPSSFECVVVPNLVSTDLDSRARLDQIRRMLDDAGVVVVGAPAQSGRLSYSEFTELAAGLFPAVRMLGQGRFSGWSIVDFERAAINADVTVDGSLIDPDGDLPDRWLAACAQTDVSLEPYTVVRVPPSATGEQAPLAGHGASGNGSDYGALERRLQDRSHELRAAQAEVERRGALVRDLVEELRLRGFPADRTSAVGGGGDAPRVSEIPTTAGNDPPALLTRTVEAEAGRAEAQFQVDELMAKLAEGERLLQELRAQEAAQSGAARGFRARIAEVEELRELAEGRLALVEHDLEAARDQEVALQRQLAELRDRFELELVRARGPAEAGPGLHAGTSFGGVERLTERYGEIGDSPGWRLAFLIGEMDGLRALLADREASCRSRERSARPAEEAEEEAQRLRSEVENLRKSDSDKAVRLEETEELLELEAGRAIDYETVVASRDALVTRLQFDLAEEERKAKEHEQRFGQLSEENERLRGALMNASERVDEVKQLEERLNSLASERAQTVAERDAALAIRDAASSTLGDTRRILISLADVLDQDAAAPVGGTDLSDITAVGTEAADASGAAMNAPAEARLTELEEVARDRETLVRSLTAQLEERNERIRGLETTIAAGGQGSGEDRAQEFAQLQERVGRLSEELLYERRARRRAESTGERLGVGSGPGSSPVSEAADREAELVSLRVEIAAHDRELRTVRRASAQAREGLEELLSAATANGDPVTAERVSALLALLPRA